MYNAISTRNEHDVNTLQQYMAYRFGPVLVGSDKWYSVVKQEYNELITVLLNADETWLVWIKASVNAEYELLYNN